MAEDRKTYRLAVGELQGKYGFILVDDAGGVSPLGPQQFSSHSQAVSWLNNLLLKLTKLEQLESTVKQLSEYVAGGHQDFKKLEARVAAMEAANKPKV